MKFEENQKKQENESNIIPNKKKNKSNKFTIVLILLFILILGWIAYNNFIMQQSIKIIKSKLTQINKPNETLITNVEKYIDEQIKQMLNKTLSVQKDLILQISRDQISKNENEGMKSFAIANQYIKNKKYDKAKIYLFNAINHAPTNPKYVEKLFNLVKDHYQNNKSAIQECRSVLELSLFQFDAADIEKSMKNIAELDKLDFDKTFVENKVIDWQNEYNILAQTKPQNIINSLEDTETYINNLTIILSNINDQEKYKILVVKIQNEVQKLENLYNLSIIASEIQSYIALLEKENDYNSELAVNRLLSAKSTATILWQQKTSDLPSDFAKLIHQTIPEKLRLIENKIAKSKSKEYFDKAMNLVNQPVGKHDKIECLIGMNTKKINEISSLIGKITFPDYQKKIIEKTKEIRNKITDYKRKQYVEYQKWVSDICLKLLNKINKEKAFTDKDAHDFFYGSDFYMIDASSLSSENNRIYNNLLQQFIGELPAKKAFEIEKKILTAEKKKMEDF